MPKKTEEKMVQVRTPLWLSVILVAVELIIFYFVITLSLARSLSVGIVAIVLSIVVLIITLYQLRKGKFSKFLMNSPSAQNI